MSEPGAVENQGFQTSSQKKSLDAILRESDRPVQSAEDLRLRSADLVKNREDDPLFARNIQFWLEQLKVLKDAEAAGSLSEEEVLEVIATQLTESEMASERDKLTGVYSREALDARALELVGIAKRNKMPLSVAFADIDNFKKFNDTYGHDVGDAVLQLVAQNLKSELKRASDILGRYGGEELVMILPETEEEGMVEFLNQIRENVTGVVAEALIEMGFSVEQPVTLSIGVAQLSDAEYEMPTEEAVKSVIKRADDKMYMSKQNGKNQVIGTKEALKYTQSTK